MKLDTVFVLEHAGWAALLANDSGVILRANKTALGIFGGITEGKTSLGASIWSSENESTPEVFLAKWERLPVPVLSLNFRLKDGSSSPFRTHLCQWAQDGQHFYLFQLLKVENSPLTNAPLGKADPERKSRSPVAPEAALGPSAALGAGLAHKQKLDCAMQLIRTVSLDFNNALTSILGHTSFILTKSAPNDPWRNSLLEVEKSAERAAEIAHDLAAFSRSEKDIQAQVAGNLNDLVRRAVELFQTSNPSANSWNLQLERKLYTVHFEEAKILQAFIRILDNALQALAAHGRITLRTQNQDVSKPLTDGLLTIPAGNYVCLEFEDNGCGIRPEIVPRIFEPFFTTKKAPHRGLGLAWVYGIVTNHGGYVAVSSNLGQGTSVRIYLPAQKKIVNDAAIALSNLSGKETILVIDDEDSLLTLCETVLTSFGYRVLSASSGQKALEIFSRAAREISLVITDIVMPVMSGRELIERLRAIDPKVKIICFSGFLRPVTLEEEEIYLQKPFTSQGLLRKVKQALARGEPN